ncbi:hypothetical protein JW835_11435 [bacterium]|nr:hypothetical protein [bacterium]
MIFIFYTLSRVARSHGLNNYRGKPCGRAYIISSALEYWNHLVSNHIYVFLPTHTTISIDLNWKQALR